MSSMSRYSNFGATTVMENLLKRKWSAVILRRFEAGLSSPDEICNLEPDLTPQVINERLRTMLRYNLLTRSPARAPARIMSYKLTPRGHRMLKMLSLVEQFDQIEDIEIKVTPAGRILVQARAADTSVAPTESFPLPPSLAG